MTFPDEEAILLAARDHRDPVERAEFLAAACNDAQQQRRVERLLALDDQSVGGARKTPGGGLMWVLPKPGLGRMDHPDRPNPQLASWWQYLGRVVG